MAFLPLRNRAVFWWELLSLIRALNPSLQWSILEFTWGLLPGLPMAISGTYRFEIWDISLIPSLLPGPCFPSKIASDPFIQMFTLWKISRPFPKFPLNHRKQPMFERWTEKSECDKNDSDYSDPLNRCTLWGFSIPWVVLVPLGN